MVAELAAACKAKGLRMGVYLSPWDRNFAGYGKPEYIEYYRQQMRELLTGYGDVCEVWFDGANGGDGFYGGARETRRIDRETYYDWPKTWKIVRELQPMAVMFSDGGPDIRWVGNESGAGVKPTGQPCARRVCSWYCQTRSLGSRPKRRYALGASGSGRFDPARLVLSRQRRQRVKTVDQLLEIYYSSVGNGANLLLNIPPDRRGRIHEVDCQRLLGLKKVLDATFDDDLAQGKPVSASDVRGDDPQFSGGKVTDGDRNTYWAANDDERTCQLTVELGSRHAAEPRPSSGVHPAGSTDRRFRDRCARGRSGRRSRPVRQSVREDPAHTNRLGRRGPFADHQQPSLPDDLHVRTVSGSRMIQGECEWGGACVLRHIGERPASAGR